MRPARCSSFTTLGTPPQRDDVSRSEIARRDAHPTAIALSDAREGTGGCAATTMLLPAPRGVRLPRQHVGMRLEFADGKSDGFIERRPPTVHSCACCLSNSAFGGPQDPPTAPEWWTLRQSRDHLTSRPHAGTPERNAADPAQDLRQNECALQFACDLSQIEYDVVMYGSPPAVLARTRSFDTRICISSLGQRMDPRLLRQQGVCLRQIQRLLLDRPPGFVGRRCATFGRLAALAV